MAAKKASPSLPPRVAEPGMSDEALTRGSGKCWDEWFALLDAWDATGKTHSEIARYVAEEFSIDGWWAQGVTVGYERARGMRKVNETQQGFSGNASKTVPVTIERLYAAFLDESIRDQWLEPGTLELRTAQENRSARFDIKGGGILEIWFISKGEKNPPQPWAQTISPIGKRWKNGSRSGRNDLVGWRNYFALLRDSV